MTMRSNSPSARRARSWTSKATGCSAKVEARLNRAGRSHVISDCRKSRRSPMRLLALIGFLAIVVAVAAAVFFFGGFFNVAATNPEPAPVSWALIKVRMAAVDRYATDQPPSGYDAQDKVQAGAKAYSARGCTNCHGGPGVEWQKFSEGLRPHPPDPTKIVKEREPRQLFWVVKNGINMTGMPSFGATGMEDPEIWSMVAFLKRLPDVKEEDFKKWVQ